MFTDRSDIIEYLLNEGYDSCSIEELESIDDESLFEELLVWEGIVGFTDEILSAVKALDLA